MVKTPGLRTDIDAGGLELPAKFLGVRDVPGEGDELFSFAILQVLLDDITDDGKIDYSLSNKVPAGLRAAITAGKKG